MNIKDWRTTLEIVERHCPNKDFADPLGAAEHDVIYLSISLFDIHPESDDGKVLKECGWYVDSDTDSWALFV